MHMSLYLSIQSLFDEQNAAPLAESVYSLNQLEIKVDTSPIGGFRSKAGNLTIGHRDHKVFTDWTEDDLQTLAELIQKILKIRENAGIVNTLIYGRQDGATDLKFCLVPYPKCNWIEKLQGLIHVIFGAPNLMNEEADRIAQYYRTVFSRDWENDSASEKYELERPDAFCKDDVINSQEIARITIEDKDYHLLHDRCPKGSTTEDPHLLALPTKEDGHYDGSQATVQQHFHILKITQKAMRILLKEGFSTLLFEERIGSQLQGVRHIHAHIKGISHFPQTLFEKIWAFFRQLLPSVLSAQDLRTRIQHYKQYDWNLEKLQP